MIKEYYLHLTLAAKQKHEHDSSIFGKDWRYFLNSDLPIRCRKNYLCSCAANCDFSHASLITKILGLNVNQIVICLNLFLLELCVKVPKYNVFCFKLK